MITPSFGLTATERVLPRLALDWTTGGIQPGVDVTRSGAATFVGSNGLIQTATADTQRINYSTGVSGLLIEESRTNSCLYSEEPENLAWTPTRTSIAVEPVSAPNGTATGKKLVEDLTTNETHRIAIPSVLVTSGQSYTFSVFLKPDERTFALIALHVTSSGNAFGGQPSLYANLINGEITDVSGTVTASSAKQFADGWWRFSITSTATTTTTNRPAVYLATAAGTARYDGNGESGFFMWGAQLEAGAFPTSYIPTEATAVTRNADVATMTGTNFSDWFNASEGTFLAQSSANAPISGTTARVYASVDDTTSNQFIILEYRLATSSRFRVQNVTSQASILSSKTSGGLNTIVAGYKTDSFIQATNTALGILDSSGDVPVGINNLKIGSRYDNLAIAFLNGTISKLAYWPHRLTNAEIQAFSKG
jgi:hypothetical protein